MRVLLLFFASTILLISCTTTRFDQFQGIYRDSRPIGLYVVGATRVTDNGDRDFEARLVSLAERYFRTVFDKEKSRTVLLNPLVHRADVFVSFSGVSRIDEKKIAKVGVASGARYSIILFYNYWGPSESRFENGESYYESMDYHSYVVDNETSEVVESLDLRNRSFNAFRRNSDEIHLWEDLTVSEKYKAFLVSFVYATFSETNDLLSFSTGIRGAAAN